MSPPQMRKPRGLGSFGAAFKKNDFGPNHSSSMGLVKPARIHRLPKRGWQRGQMMRPAKSGPRRDFSGAAIYRAQPFGKKRMAPRVVSKAEARRIVFAAFSAAIAPAGKRGRHGRC